MDHKSSFFSPRHDPNNRVEKPQPVNNLAALKARVAAALGTSKKPTGGLNVSLHPALEDLSQWNPSGRSASKTSSAGLHNEPPTTQAVAAGLGFRNSSFSPEINPYYDPNSAGHVSGKQRPVRPLIFNPRGKYIQQGNALRKQAQLEAMKKRIADQKRKAGIDDDRDVEKNFIVSEPPQIEWWDEGLVDGQSYDVIGDEKYLKFSGPDSIVSEYIQHPVPLEPPQDKNIPPQKPMFRTRKEQEKQRRQCRMAAQKDQQAKIRLGLEPAPPPKVKKGNLMRVLGEEAVKDPTAVEARVNREIAERHNKHLEVNEERRLTKEQRRDKLAQNQAKDAAKGIRMLVFKINSLANGQHRYKVGINAEQHTLTGVCIMHPRFCLVVVEGGEYSIKKYKSLMLNRIDWSDNAPSREKTTDASASSEGKQLRDWLSAEDESGQLKDMSTNACSLIFEGEVKARAFRKWSSKICETDAEAREVLSRVKMENFWQQAKAYTTVH